MASIEEVTNVAQQFAVSNGYQNTRLAKVELKENEWTVYLDPMLIFQALVIEIVINNETLEILKFERHFQQTK